MVSEKEWRRQNLEWERRRREAEERSFRIHQRDIDECRDRMVLRQQQKDADSVRRRRENAAVLNFDSGINDEYATGDGEGEEAVGSGRVRVDPGLGVKVTEINLRFVIFENVTASVFPI